MRKRYLVIFLSLFMIPCFVKAIDTSATSAILMDMDSNRILYSKNIHTIRSVASISKIMTAHVAIKYGKLNQIVTIGDEIKKAYGSGIYIKQGEKIKLLDLLYGLMLRSGNDAALSIAKAVAGDTSKFVEKMNQEAKIIGMKDTTFNNPSGLDEEEGNYSTSYDMALLMSEAMKNSTFRKITKTKKYTLTTNKNHYTWINKNKLLREDYITGGKTGFTELARRTLVSTGSKNNINIVVVTLNDPNDWADHKELYNNIFKNYQSYKIINKKKFKVDNEEYYDDGELFVKNDFYMALTKKELKKVTLNINLMRLKNYNDDDIVGYAEVKLGKEIYHKEPIYIKKINKDKEEDLTWWQKFRGWLFKW